MRSAAVCVCSDCCLVQVIFGVHWFGHSSVLIVINDEWWLQVVYEEAGEARQRPAVSGRARRSLHLYSALPASASFSCADSSFVMHATTVPELEVLHAVRDRLREIAGDDRARVQGDAAAQSVAAWRRELAAQPRCAADHPDSAVRIILGGSRPKRQQSTMTFVAVAAGSRVTFCCSKS